MRYRFALAIVLVLLIGNAVPAAAAPDNSPVFEAEELYAEIEFPNPCLGEDAVELYLFEGRLVFHEFTNPSGNYHFNDVGYLSASTESGFSMPEKMIGVDVENISDNTYTYTSIGLYQLRNDEGQKLRIRFKIQETVVGGEAKVELFAFDFVCLGNGR